MFEKIIQSAKEQKKNILIIGSPRSGTHALGAELANISQACCIGEIYKTPDNPQPWKLLYNTDCLTIGQLVQLTSKIYLSRNINTIKNSNVIVNIRRKNKVKQFASWMYFRVLDPTEFRSWHNHTSDKTTVAEHSIEASEHDLIQFMLEQLVDDYFLPDFNLCYENISFTQTQYQKNNFAYPIENMFSNLDYVKNYIENWQYSPGHFTNAK